MSKPNFWGIVVSGAKALESSKEQTIEDLAEKESNGFFQKIKRVALGLFVGASSLIVGSTPAHADLTTDLATVTTAATSGVALVSTSQATVIASVFGLVLLAVGAKWIFGSIKAR